MERHASAVWQGGLKDGAGKITTNSGVLSNVEYSFGTRFENHGGTNPEELIAAAHAACFSMSLSGRLVKAGLAPDRITTSGTATLERVGQEWTVTAMQLDTIAFVPGADQATFDKAAREAKDGCPVSRLLKAKITLNARLESHSYEERQAG